MQPIVSIHVVKSEELECFVLCNTSRIYDQEHVYWCSAPQLHSLLLDISCMHKKENERFNVKQRKSESGLPICFGV